MRTGELLETAAGAGGGLRSPALEATGVPHLFTAGDVDEHALAAVLGRAECELVRARQVHGADVLDADHARTDPAPAADAVVTSRTDRVVAVVTADCVPVLLASVDGARVAAVHAGWRGLVAGVIPAAARAFDGRPLVAAVGPCLSLERFEVGPEVAAAFVAAGLGAAVRPPATGDGRPHVDLRAAAALQLRRAGVAALDVARTCTWEDPRLHSYRRDVTHGGAERTGRQWAAIAPR